MANVDNPEQLPTVISFCSGYAGIERGLDLAGFRHRVVCYVEIEAFAIANLVAKMETGELGPAPIYTDLKTFPAHLFRDRIELITGGYPCQPFSAAGNRKGADDPRHLWPFIRRHVQTIRPARCFFENVEGHISLGLSTVISDLEDDSYQAAWGIFSAEEVGAPHRRKRVFILGNATDSGCDSSENKLGDAQHHGLPASAERGSNSKNGAGTEERQISAVESQRASEPEGRGNISETELADPGRCSSGEGVEPTKLRSARAGEPSGGSRGSCGPAENDEGQKWPARPGEKQHDWEPPRTVWKAKPGLGGDTDGSPDRIDRIRLLGNGVVPSTAAKAWQVLDAELIPPTEETGS